MKSDDAFDYGDKDVALWALLRRTWPLISVATEKKLGALGLTPEKVSILWLQELISPEPMFPAFIARALARQSQSVAGLVNRMEEDGLVRRIPKKRKHPFTEIIISEKGRVAAAAAIPIMKDVIHQICGVLDEDEKDSMVEMLTKISQAALGIRSARFPEAEKP